MALGWGVHQVMEICIALLSLSIQFGTVTATIEGEFANFMQLQLRGAGITYFRVPISYYVQLKV